MSKRVCVIGGGISGLCVAYGLKRAGVDVILFEKDSSVGGNIKTETRHGFLIEHGPNTTLASRELLDLIKDLGISDQIAQSNPNAKKRYILRGGKLIALPSTIIGLVGNKAFSAKAKLRLLKEPFIRTRSTENESVSAFFERRVGKEIVDYAVDPFISGIYAGDPQKLSIRHAFPRLFELERDFGSLLKGAIFRRKDKASKLPKDTPRSITFEKGMQTLTDVLSNNLNENIRLGTSVTKITNVGSQKFRVRTGEGEDEYDAVVVCTPAHQAAGIIEDIDSVLAKELRSIHYPPIAVVFTAFKHEDVRTDPNGFGFLIPGIERRKILGSLWTSSVFENRAPKRYHLFTTFIGGSRNADIASNTDDRLIQIALDELDSILGIECSPEFATVKKWEKAIPQYNIGQEFLVEAIEAFKSNNSGIFFCSNFYKGISVTDCIKNSVATTQKVLDRLNA